MSFYCENCDARMGVVMTRGSLRYRRCERCNHRCWTEEMERDDLPAYREPGRRPVEARPARRSQRARSQNLSAV